VRKIFMCTTVVVATMLSVGSVGPTVALAAEPVDSPINTFWGYAGLVLRRTRWRTF